MAQLIARSVWDREVEGLSPFTPTKENDHHYDGLFLWSELDSNLRLFVEYKNSRRFGVVREVKKCLHFFKSERKRL